MTTIVAKIQRRRGAAAAWTSNNPTLLAGEEGHESDTGKYKVGDGTTAWTSLAYFFDPGDYGDVTGPASSTDNALARFHETGGKTLQDSTATLSDAGALTLNNGTLTADAPVLDVAQTWNNAAVAFTGVKVNITNTASFAAGSNPLVVSVNGSTVLNLRADGKLDLSTGTAGISFIEGSSTYVIGRNGNSAFFGYSCTASNCAFGVFENNFRLANDKNINWCSTNYATTIDLSLARDAADTLAQRRATNAQTYRLYNTYTNADNYERFSIGWDTNVLKLKNEAAGTGTLRPITVEGGMGVDGGTVTTSNPALNITQTWNDAAVEFTAIKANVTDTASAAAAKLLDLQVNGTSQLVVDKAGSLEWGVTTLKITSNRFDFAQSGYNIVSLNVNGGVQVRSTGVFGWTSGASSLTPDLLLYRDAADTLAQRRATNAQTYRLYNTYTDADNYERLSMEWDANIMKIWTRNEGTGVARSMWLGRGFNNTRIELAGEIKLSPGGSVTLTCNVNRTIFNGTLELNTGYTVATLPTAVLGKQARVTDADTPVMGSTVVGGGAAAALVWYNGTNWTVIGV